MFYFLSTLAGFPDILNYIKCNGGVGTAKTPNLQTTLLDRVDVGTPKWRVSMGGLIDRVHEAMNPSLM